MPHHATPTLIIETTTVRASVALALEDGHWFDQSWESDRNHNSQIFTPLETLLHAANCRPLEIGLVLVGSGPGSYSGTRVGISAALGMAIAASCQVAAVPSILATPTARSGGRCLTVGDARRGSFWSAEIFSSRLLAMPILADLPVFLQTVAEARERGAALVSFESPALFPPDIAANGSLHQEFPHAAGLWQAWLAADEATRIDWTTQTPEPIYLKPPLITPSKKSWSLAQR